MIKLVQIKQRQRGALRIRRTGNPDCELIRIQLTDLCGRAGGDFVLLRFDLFGLQAGFAHFQTSKPCVIEKPQPVLGHLSLRGAQSSVVHDRFKHFLGFDSVAQHQKAEPIELRQILIRRTVLLQTGEAEGYAL